MAFRIHGFFFEFSEFFRHPRPRRFMRFSSQSPGIWRWMERSCTWRALRWPTLAVCYLPASASGDLEKSRNPGKPSPRPFKGEQSEGWESAGNHVMSSDTNKYQKNRAQKFNGSSGCIFKNCSRTSLHATHEFLCSSNWARFFTFRTCHVPSELVQSKQSQNPFRWINRKNRWNNIQIDKQSK